MTDKEIIKALCNCRRANGAMMNVRITETSGTGIHGNTAMTSYLLMQLSIYKPCSITLILQVATYPSSKNGIVTCSTSS